MNVIMQGKWHRVHTASCRCYRLIHSEYPFIFCIVYLVFAFLYFMYLQGKWRRGRVHTASCRCYRLIDREYHNLMVRFPLLSLNHQHCSWQENFVIAIFYFLYSLLYSVLVFGIWSGPLPQPPTPAPNIIARKFCILHSHCLIFGNLYFVFGQNPPPHPPTPVQNIVCEETVSPDFYLLLLMW